MKCLQVKKKNWRYVEKPLGVTELNFVSRTQGVELDVTSLGMLFVVK